MALYSYEAFSKDGKRVRGVIDASSIASVKEQLTKQGLFPTKIKTAKEQARHGVLGSLFMRGVSVKEKILFTKQFAILLKSGVPLLQSVELLVEQFEGRLRTILIAIKDDIKEGSSLADALKKHPKVFDNIYVQLVRAGEASGKLEMILERLTSYMERRLAVTKQVKGALLMPVIQAVIAVGVVAILLTQVVPQMAGAFASQGQALPGSTQFLLSVSDFVRNRFLLLISSITLFVMAFTYWKRTPKGKRTIDTIKLRLPLIKYQSRTNAVVQFSYTLGMLLEGGVNLAEALDIVCAIIDNRVLADALIEARDKIIKQGKIAEYLRQTGMFPAIAVYLIKTGEESGQLDTMLLTVAHNYEEELIELSNRLTTLLGPATMIVMAVVIGFIVMAIAGPIMNMGKGLIV